MTKENRVAPIGHPNYDPINEVDQPLDYVLSENGMGHPRKEPQRKIDRNIETLLRKRIMNAEDISNILGTMEGSKKRSKEYRYRRVYDLTRENPKGIVKRYISLRSMMFGMN